jgi:hypothetical protein
MTNKTLGLVTLISYALAFVFFMAGGYTEEVTAWDQLGTLGVFVGFVVSIWGAIRLAKMK